MPLLLKYLVFTFLLTLYGIWSSAQRTESSGRVADTARRKLSVFQRRRLDMTQLMDLRRQQLAGRQREMDERPFRRGDSARWILTFNPFGVLELQGALGLGIGYYITPHWQVWSETSGLFQLYQKPAQSCLGGIREILAIKYYFGYRQTLFFAGEFRYKDVYFHDVHDFFDQVSTYTIRNYTYKIEDIVFGGSVWFGGRINISRSHRLRLEPNIGLGFKSRTIVWHGVPDGYSYPRQPGLHIDLFPNPVRTPAPMAVYFPATVRLVYAL